MTESAIFPTHAPPFILTSGIDGEGGCVPTVHHEKHHVRLFVCSTYASPFWAAAPKGSMTYAFTHMGNFLLLLLLLLLRPPPPASRPISQPGGPYPSLEAQISVLRPKSHPQGPNPNPKAQIPVSRDLGLKTGIWASRLGYGPPG